MAVLGVVALTCGYLLLTTWEATEAGLNCGSPLDNPGWRTGVPCHGAVNRQTAVGFAAAMGGLSLLGGAVVLIVLPLSGWATPSE